MPPLGRLIEVGSAGTRLIALTSGHGVSYPRNEKST